MLKPANFSWVALKPAVFKSVVPKSLRTDWPVKTTAAGSVVPKPAAFRSVVQQPSGRFQIGRAEVVAYRVPESKPAAACCFRIVRVKACWCRIGRAAARCFQIGRTDACSFRSVALTHAAFVSSRSNLLLSDGSR